MCGMSYIQDGLYLGSVDDAYKTEELLKKGITHILSIEHNPLEMKATANFKYKYICAHDMESVDLLNHFDECNSFIQEGRTAGGVFVHCYFGHSRSATVVLAYLMNKMDLPLDDARAMVMRTRPKIQPNPGFLDQLKLYERMGNHIDKNNEQYKHYQLHILSQKIQAAQIHDIPHESFQLDPCETGLPGQSQDSAGILYKCRKCRRPLFKSSGLLSHKVGRGAASFDWRAKTSTSEGDTNAGEGGSDAESSGDAQICRQSLFIEPVQWMGDDILVLEGKLSCPKCHAKLGSFNWTGERCPCGTWVTPAFHVNAGRVDECKIRAVQPMPARPLPSRPVARVSPSHVTQSSTLVSAHGYSRTSDENCDNPPTDEHMPSLS